MGESGRCGHRPDHSKSAGYRWRHCRRQCGGSSGQIVLLDFGATRHFKAGFVNNYRKLLAAAMSRDHDKLIAAAVIGGTSLAGGVGTIAGAILGAVIMQSLESGMVLMGVTSAMRQVVIGLVLVLAGLAVAFSLYIKRSWIGFAFEAVADDEDTARVLSGQALRDLPRPVRRAVVHHQEVHGRVQSEDGGGDEESGKPYGHLVLRPYPEEFVTSRTLGDGTTVVLRPIRPEDEPLWKHLLATCSKETLYARFGYLSHLRNDHGRDLGPGIDAPPEPAEYEHGSQAGAGIDDEYPGP